MEATSPCPSIAADDGVAAGEAVECFNPNAAVMKAEALSRKLGVVGAVAFSRSGDPATAIRGRDRDPEVRRGAGRSERALKPWGSAFKSNWLRNLSAIASIISERSGSCGPSVMIATFQVSSQGTTEMARSVGHSQMSSISSLIAASSSSRVFAGFFKLSILSAARNGTTAFGYPRERMF